jgi:hypothetical protein
MQNYRVIENAKKDPFIFKHEDIRGGVTIDGEELGAASVVEAGTAFGLDSNGLGHVIKTASLYEDEASNETGYKVLKGHGFKVGDIAALDKASSKAYAISGINTGNAAYDVITVGTSLGVAALAGDVIFEAAAQDATGGNHSLKYAPYGLVGTGFQVVKGGNHLTQGVVRGTVQEDIMSFGLPDKVKNALPLIRFV